MRSVTKSKRFFFNDTATTEIYTLSLHDALPISDPALDPPCPLFASPLRPLRAGARGLHPLHLPDTTLRRRTRPSGSAGRRTPARPRGRRGAHLGEGVPEHDLRAHRRRVHADVAHEIGRASCRERV